MISGRPHGSDRASVQVDYAIHGHVTDKSGYIL